MNKYAVNNIEWANLHKDKKFRTLLEVQEYVVRNHKYLGLSFATFCEDTIKKGEWQNVACYANAAFVLAPDLCYSQESLNLCEKYYKNLSWQKICDLAHLAFYSSYLHVRCHAKRILDKYRKSLLCV
jgi:hypothetical protein